MFFRRKTRFLGSWAITKTIAFIAEGRRKFGNGFAWRGLNGCKEWMLKKEARRNKSKDFSN
jgi:hypothetical protein